MIGRGRFLCLEIYADMRNKKYKREIQYRTIFGTEEKPKQVSISSCMRDILANNFDELIVIII